MNPAVAFLPKFFVISSVILILTGVAQVLVRPRKDKETVGQKIVNRSTITALVSVGVGVFFLLVGLGVMPMPHFR
jgi:hypothetical protein